MNRRFQHEHARGGKSLQQLVLELTLRLGNICKGEPSGDPTLDCAGALIVAHQISQSLLMEYLDGIALNLVRRRYRDWTQLQQYAHTTRVVPALMAASILDLDSEAARRHLPALGKASALIDILLNLGADLDQGRIYLPEQEIDEFGASPEDFVARCETDALRALATHQLDRAATLLQEAQPLLNHLSPPTTHRWAQRLFDLHRLHLTNLRQAPLAGLHPGSIGPGKLARWKTLLIGSGDQGPGNG